VGLGARRHRILRLWPGQRPVGRPVVCREAWSADLLPTAFGGTAWAARSMDLGCSAGGAGRRSAGSATSCVPRPSAGSCWSRPPCWRWSWRTRRGATRTRRPATCGSGSRWRCSRWRCSRCWCSGGCGPGGCCCRSPPRRGCWCTSPGCTPVAGVLLGFTVPVIRRRPGPGPGLAEHFEHRFRPLSTGVAVPVLAFFAAGVRFTHAQLAEGSAALQVL
jgi:Na+/H+ antiporter 1